MEPKNNTPQAGSGHKPRRKLDIWNKMAVLILTLFLVGCVSVFFVLVNIINDPEGMRFSRDGLSTLSNSRIFAADGTMVYEVGEEIRENITYEQLPQNVIDAFLAIEDSRFFTHNGFDLPRFMAAGIANLQSGGFSQGGSTLTMQMIDNAFTKNQEKRLQEEQGSLSTLDKLKLKTQEIYLALVAEQALDKEDIMEYYLNRIWFGSGGTTRGIQKAAKYYFNKDVSQLNLGEAAFLAGSINAPGLYNPLYNISDKELGVESSVDHLAAGTQRRNETLQLMLNHGYITEEEYQLETSTDLAFALDYRETISTDPNQAYIDQVLEEAATLTGQDPSIIPMDIYTALNIGAQAELDAIMNGDIIPFPNAEMDFGTAIIDNAEGEIIAVGAGRHYHSDKVKQDNSINTKQPGSAMKPLLAYCSTFDVLGWSTTHVVDDKAEDYWQSGSNLRNADGKYDGKMTLANALGVSKNTTAAATMVELVNVLGYNYWIDFCRKLGFDETVCENFNPQYSIGGSDMYASPVQMASAYSMFANEGVRVNAHRIRRIIRRSDQQEVNGNTTRNEIISSQAAFMMSDLLRNVVYGGYGNYNEILGSPSYVAYGKSGTSSWEEEGAMYGIPAGVMKDEWSLGYTSTYSIATWSGYLPQYAQQGYYLTLAELEAAPAFHINRHMLDYLEAEGNYHAIERPDGVSDYNGGYIKTEFLSKGDPTSGTATTQQNESPTADDTTETELETEKKACEASGGTFDNGACSCPDGYTLNGSACVPPTTEDKTDTPATEEPSTPEYTPPVETPVTPEPETPGIEETPEETPGDTGDTGSEWENPTGFVWYMRRLRDLVNA